MPSDGYDGPIIDAHSHFGRDLHWELYGDIGEYLRKVKSMGIGHSILAPCPTSVYQNNPDSPITVPSVWEESGDEIEYNTILLGEKIKQRLFPYNNKNIVENLCKRYNHISFLPLYHPKLDDTSFITTNISEVLDEKGVVGLKVHGVATHTGPEDIRKRSEIIDLLIHREKVLVVHTDFHGSPSNALERAYAKNNPQDWLDLAEDYPKLKIMLTHGLRGDIDSIARVGTGNLKNVVVGISPSWNLISQKDRLMCEPKYYLPNLINNLDSEQLVFDLDYPWNVMRVDGQLELEWTEKTRCLQVMDNRRAYPDELNYQDDNWSLREKENFFYKNAIKFFNLSIDL